MCGDDDEAPLLFGPKGGWSRPAVLDWLSSGVPTDCVIGLDLGAALPFVDAGAYFPGWPASPADAKALWALIDDLCMPDPHLAATGFVDHVEASRHFRRHGGRRGTHFVGRGRLRVTELAQATAGLRPYSNLNLVGAAQVGKSSLTGMRVLHRLQAHIPVWPFDPLPDRGAVIVEIYTSLAARAAGRPPGRSKMRSAADLDTALGTLGSRPSGLSGPIDDHASDAILTAAWLRTVAHDAALWSPAALTPAIAMTEGWTFGIA